MTDAISSLIDGIMYAVKILINKAEYDQTVSGHILYYAGDNKYVVKVNNENYTVKSNGLFNTFDSVEITKPKNKWLNAYISYPNTVNITAEELSADAEVLRQKAEEIRIKNENERVINEEIRNDSYTEYVAKFNEYDKAEADRSVLFSTSIQAISDAQSSYHTLSQNVSAITNECEKAIVRCETAAQRCEEIALNGYVTNDQLSGLCKLVQENGKVYLEVI